MVIFSKLILKFKVSIRFLIRKFDFKFSEIKSKYDESFNIYHKFKGFVRELRKVLFKAGGYHYTHLADNIKDSIKLLNGAFSKFVTCQNVEFFFRSTEMAKLRKCRKIMRKCRQITFSTFRHGHFL